MTYPRRATRATFLSIIDRREFIEETWMTRSKKEKKDEGVITTVAKTVGGALGAIAATAADLVGNKASKKSAPKRTPKAEKVHTPRASVATKKKRAKHKRKLGRRAKG